MRLSAMLRAATLAGLLVLTAPERPAACAFHSVLPEATISEQIAGSIEVIAARPSAADPFRFEVVAVLRGAASKTSPPHLVDSGMRARLARDPDDAVLFAHNVDGSWTRLLVLDATTRPVVEDVLARAAVWATPGGAAERRDYFAGLLDHPDDQLRRFALGELAALPYGVLRSGVYTISDSDLLRGLADIEDMPFAAIRILLLGLNGGGGARDVIAARLAGLASSGANTDLGAWITAAIESGGPAGVARVERLFFGQPGGLTQGQLISIVRALSLHSSEGDPALRIPLNGALRRLVSLHPNAVPPCRPGFRCLRNSLADRSVRDALPPARSPTATARITNLSRELPVLDSLYRASRADTSEGCFVPGAVRR